MWVELTFGTDTIPRKKWSSHSEPEHLKNILKDPSGQTIYQTDISESQGGTQASVPLKAPQVTLQVQPRLRTALEVLRWPECLLKGLCPPCGNVLLLLALLRQ